VPFTNVFWYFFIAARSELPVLECSLVYRARPTRCLRLVFFYPHFPTRILSFLFLLFHPDKTWFFWFLRLCPPSCSPHMSILGAESFRVFFAWSLPLFADQSDFKVSSPPPSPFSSQFPRSYEPGYNLSLLISFSHAGTRLALSKFSFTQQAFLPLSPTPPPSPNYISSKTSTPLFPGEPPIRTAVFPLPLFVRHVSSLLQR